MNIPVWKKKEVERLIELLKESPVIAVVDIEGIPALQLQQMRAKLRDTLVLTVSRNTLIQRALEKVKEEKENIEDLENHLSGQTALIATEMNPFKLFNRMEDTKTNAPASGGEVAPSNIKVQKGNTPFKPGPIVGDLQKVGIPASIESGKVMIKKTRIVVKEGEVISADLAKMLTRLDINPIIVGLNLRIVYEDGTLFDRDTLDVDPSEIKEDIKRCIGEAFNLSVFAAYPTKENITTLLQKTHMDAFSLAMNSDMIVEETLELKLSEAQMKMLALAAKLDPASLDPELLEMLGIEVEQDEKVDEEDVSDNEEKVDEEDVSDNDENNNENEEDSSDNE